MNKPLVGAILAAVVLGGAGAYYWSTHKAVGPNTSLAAGYETEALAAPFTLTSKTWDQSAGTWAYKYADTITTADAITAVKTQLAASRGYQVVATQPDQIASDNSSATLYRDLITEDVALRVQITPTLVTVTLSPMQGK